MSGRCSPTRTASSPCPPGCWGEYGQRDVFAGVPCIVNRNGVDRVLELSLTEEERQKLADSCAILQESYQGLEL